MSESRSGWEQIVSKKRKTQMKPLPSTTGIGRRDPTAIGRRGFLACSGAIVAGAPFLVPAAAIGRDGHTAPSERISIGMIGAGARGGPTQLGGILAGMNDVQIVATCDPDWRRRHTMRLFVGVAYAARRHVPLFETRRRPDSATAIGRIECDYGLGGGSRTASPDDAILSQSRTSHGLPGLCSERLADR